MHDFSYTPIATNELFLNFVVQAFDTQIGKAVVIFALLSISIS